MNHFSPERIKQIGGNNFENADITDEEFAHMNQCDYCMEGMLLGEDPETYELRVYKKATTKRPVS